MKAVMRRRGIVALGFVLLGLSGCGGGDGGDSGALEPDIVFTPNTVAAGGQIELQLIIRNRRSSDVGNVHVEYLFPAGVSIEGGTVGTLCPQMTGGDATPTGYQFTVAALAPDFTCGVFMQLNVNTAGDKTFEVPVGGATGDGGARNNDPFFATLDVT